MKRITRNLETPEVDPLEPEDNPIAPENNPIEPEEQLDLLLTQIQDEQELKRSRRNKFLIRALALVLALSFIPLIFSGTLRLLGMPSFSLLLNSIDLSRDPRYAMLSQAVVAVQAENRQGTGFVVQPQGLIITNNHIIEDARLVQIGFESIDLIPSTSWQQWPELDLALIQADGPEMTEIGLELTKTTPSPGEQVTVIGNPLGLFQIVSQAEYIGKTLLPDRGTPVLLLRGPVFPGNSGSPVINTEGKVIGILFAVAKDTGSDSQNSLAYVIPAADILEKLEEVGPD